jgi:hypothetical protein
MKMNEQMAPTRDNRWRCVGTTEFTKFSICVGVSIVNYHIVKAATVVGGRNLQNEVGEIHTHLLALWNSDVEVAIQVGRILVWITQGCDDSSRLKIVQINSLLVTSFDDAKLLAQKEEQK